MYNLCPIYQRMLTFLKGIPANSASGKSAQTLNPEPSTSPPPSKTHPSTTQPFPLPSTSLTAFPLAMPSNTWSAKPRNCSGLQCQSPPTEKWKRAESGANTLNKKQKAATKETTEDINNESQVMGKGKGTAKGRKKGMKHLRYVAQLTTPSPTHFFLGKWLPIMPRKMLLLMQQGPPAS